MRLDEAPLDRNQGLYRLKETDPDATQLSRRPGSLRQAEYAEAPALSCTGAATATMDTAFDFGGTILFSVRPGSGANDRRLLDIVGANDTYRVTLTDETTITVYAEGGGGNDDGTFTISGDTDLALSKNGSDLTLRDGTSTLTIDLSTLTVVDTSFVLTLFGPAASTHRDPTALSNIHIFESYQASPSYGSRTQASADYSFPLNSGLPGRQVDTVASAVLASNTTAPSYVVGTGLQFNGQSGAAVIEQNSSTYRYFQLASQATSTTEWCFQTTLTTKAAGVNETIADFGDLLLLRRTSSDQIEAVINGVTLTDATSAVGAGVTAFISVGQGSSGTRMAVTIGGTTVATTGAAVQPPYLDFAYIQDFYIGSAETPSEHFSGSIASFGLHPTFSDDELPDEFASFMFRPDSATPDLDQGLEGNRHYLSRHTATEGWTGWTGGPIDDAAHLVLPGGKAAGPSGIAGHQSNLDELIADGDRSVRLGHQAYGPTWLTDLVRKRARSLGLPRPQRKASLSVLSPGVLDAAYSYGVQAIAYDGSAGPILPIGEVAATRGSRVLIGASSQSTGFGTSELGETYLLTGSEAVGSEGDQLSATLSATPSVGENLPVEILGSLPDWTSDTYREEIDMRGATKVSAGSTDRAYWVTTPTDVGLDMSDDWCFQVAFRYQTPITDTDGWAAFPICALQAATPSTAGGSSTVNADFCAFLTEGHDLVTGEYGTSVPQAPELVVGFARQEFDVSTRGGSAEADNVHANFIPITFDDTNEPEWAVGNDYVVYFQRSGTDFEVYVNDRTNNTWHTLTSNSMAQLTSVATYGPGTAAAVPAYTNTNFFSTTNWRPKRTGHRAIVGGCGNSYARFPFIASTGQVDQTAAEVIDATWTAGMSAVKGAPADATFWHSRIWARSLSLVDIKADAHLRFAAFPGEPLDRDIVSDFAPIFEDPNEDSTKRYDAALQTEWRFYEGPTTSIKATHSAQDDSARAPIVAPLLELQADGNTLGANGVSVYFTELGDGTMVVQVGPDGAYTIPTKIWDAQSADTKFTKTIEELRGIGATLNDWDRDNWFSFDIDIQGGAGSARTISVGHLAVNGDTVFSTSIGGSSQIDGWSTGDGIVHIGGYADPATKTNVATRVSEFRMWADGQGPDIDKGTGFDYLQGRVSENEYTNGTTNLIFYARMQPDDEITPGVTVENLGSAGNFTFQENADLIDSRETGGTSGAPTVSLPLVPPHPDVARLRIVRSAGIPIVDPDNADDVQNGLQAVRGADLFVLVSVPTGTTHVVDNFPDEALGLPVDRLTGYVPQGVVDVTTWQGRLALLDDRNTLHVSDAGNRESFAAPYELPIGESAGVAQAVVEVQGQRNQAFLLVAGRSWAGLVGGTPDAPIWRSLGPGAGAWSSDAMVSYSGLAFLFNGRLWALADGDTSDVGEPVQHLMPEPANCRLSVSGSLQSLFVTDTSTGIALRYHLPTRKWTEEDRSALLIGDGPDGTEAIIHEHGSWSLGSSTVYADDADASVAASYTGTLSAQVLTLVSATGLVNGQHYYLVDQNNLVQSGIGTLSGSTLTFTGLSLADGAVTAYPAAPLTLDSGAIDAQSERNLPALQSEILAGTLWQAAYWASRTPGNLETVPNSMSYDSLAGRMGSGLRGRFHRVIVRHLGAESASVSILDLLTENN